MNWLLGLPVPVEFGAGCAVTEYGVSEADFPAIALETRTSFGMRVDAGPCATRCGRAGVDPVPVRGAVERTEGDRW